MKFFNNLEAWNKVKVMNSWQYQSAMKTHQDFTTVKWMKFLITGNVNIIM